MIKRIAGWKGRLLSYGGRLTLLNSCLASIPIYLMSIIKFPKWDIKLFNSRMSHFFWDNTEEKHKYHLANWHLVSHKKEFGGLGVPDLRNLNMCLLASWIQRYNLSDNVLWKNIVYYKYRTHQPNLFCCPNYGTSPFWKGVLWAAQAARLGYCWKVGNGRKVRFWKDMWFGGSSFAVQYWPLYVINNEKGITIERAWDGVNLKLTFRRAIPERLMLLWEELLQIASTIEFSDNDDDIIWQYDSKGKYSVQSLYSVVSFRGVTPVHVPAVWKLIIPPRIHIFLWLLSRNKLLTRDNLGKKRELQDQTCLFCCEIESVNHLFFDCCVAKAIWSEISILMDKEVGQDFESVARWWISNNKNEILNCVCAATLWVLWKLRNGLCFQGKCWRGVEPVLGSVARMLERWKVLLKDDKCTVMEVYIGKLEVPGTRLPRIMGAMEGSSLGVSLSTLSQQVSSAADQEGDEPLLPRVDVLSLVPLSAAVVSDLDVEPSSSAGVPYTLF